MSECVTRGGTFLIYFGTEIDLGSFKPVQMGKVYWWLSLTLFKEVTVPSKGRSGLKCHARW